MSSITITELIPLDVVDIGIPFVQISYLGDNVVGDNGLPFSGVTPALDSTINLTSGSLSFTGNTFTITSEFANSNSASLIAASINLQASSFVVHNPEQVTVNILSGSINLVATYLRVASSTLKATDAYTFTNIGIGSQGYLSADLFEYDLPAIYPFHVSAVSLDSSGAVLTKLGHVDSEHKVILGGFNDLTYLDDFYNRIHIQYQTLDVGNILADQFYTIEVWNAYFIPKLLSSIDEVNLSGMLLEAPYTIPHTFTPLQSFLFTLSVSLAGAGTIDGKYIFNFPSKTIELFIIGNRVILFPFVPLIENTESREWLTEIIPSRSNESRYALRECPRTTLSYKYLFQSHEEYLAALALARASTNLGFGVPNWANISKLTQRISSGVSNIYFDTTNMEIVADSLVLIWEAYDSYTLVQVLTVFADHIVLRAPIVRGYTDATWAILVKTGTSNGVRVSLGIDHRKEATIELVTPFTYVDPIWTDTDTYLSLPILSDISSTVGGLTGTISKEMGGVDNSIGNYIKLDIEDYMRATFAISLVAHSKTELTRYRRMFDYLEGKHNPFWLPSYTNDIIAVEDMNPGATGVRVLKGIWVRYPPTTIRIHGSFTVIKSISSITDNLDGTINLVFDSYVVGTLIDIVRIEILRKVRLNSDAIEYNHKTRNLTTIKVNVIEVL